MLPLRRSIFLRTSALIVLLVATICVGLSIFAVRDQREVEASRARAMAVFLAERARPYLVHEERAGLANFLSQMVGSHGGVLYATVRRGGAIWVQTTPLVPGAGAAAVAPPPGHGAATRVVSLGRGRTAYDSAIAVTGTDGVLHVGTPQPTLAGTTTTRLVAIGGLGLLALLLGLALAWWVALRTTREVDRQERALRASERRYRLLFDQAPDSILLLDPTAPGGATILDANVATCRTHGFTRDELIGRPIGDLDVASDRVRVGERVDELVRGKTVTFEVEHVRRDGTVFPVEVIAQQIEIDGKPVIQAIDRDISERRRAAAEHERLEEQLRQAQKLQAIGQLAGGVAHDLNNILGGIMGAASLLEAGLAPGDVHHEHVRHVLEACERGRDLTRNLLGFARKGSYVKAPLDVNELVAETVALLGRTVPRKIAIAADPGRDLPPVLGDRSQLSQALMNVYLNAVAAMPDGGSLTVSTRERILAAPEQQRGETLAAGRYVEIAVRDTGTGMDAETLARAFEPFFTTKAVGEGTGLGLAMVYGTARSHDGAVRLHSVVGGGTTVQLLLPVTATAPPAARPQAGPAAHRGSGTILLVDDEKLVRWAGENMLKKLGYQVVVAEDGREALARYRQHRDDVALVILDLIMPSMDGAETFDALRELDPEVKVLIASGYSKDEKLEALLERGAAGFIEKPYDLRQLGAKLDEVLK